MVVVNGVGTVDGGCAGVDGGDVAALAGKGGLVMRAVGSFLVWVVGMCVGAILWVLIVCSAVLELQITGRSCLLSR